MIVAAESTESLTTPMLGGSGQPLSQQAYIRGKKRRKFPGFCILVSVVLERLAYYSLLGNLVVYLTTVLNWNSASTLAMTLLFTGFTWISCFIGGMSGDVVYGRMNTICLGLVLYFIGYLCLPFITFVVKPGSDGSSPFIVLWLFAALILISIGEGCFKSNMSPFGADQVDNENKNKFFNFYYWAINIGSFLGFGPVVYLQEKENFIYGHALPAGCLLLALTFFMLPRSVGYISNPPAPNIIKKIFQIIREARRNRKKTPAQSPSEYTGSGCYEDYVPIKHWLDRAKAKYGGSYLEADVDEVKVFLRMLPIFGFLVIYCILYYQTNSTFIVQGMHLDVSIVKNFPVPVAWLAITNIIFVLVFLPIISKGLFPCLKKFNLEPSYFTKIMIGMFIASLAMLSAAILDKERCSESTMVFNKISRYNVTGRKVTIFAQVAQFGLMGISEIFVMITGLEFAYCQAPKRLQALVTGLFFIANGIGSLLGSLLFELYAVGMPGHLDVDMSEQQKIGDLKGRLDYFFYGLAALNFVNLLCFARYTKKLDIKEKKSSQSVNEFLRSNLLRTPQKT